jgi:hypothetical protein
MEFTIVNQSLEAQPVSEGTYLSSKGTTLRQLTISFTFRGSSASDQYNHLAQQAKKNGLLSKDVDSEIKWELYDETGTTWESVENYIVYTGLWTLREKEDWLKA